jgi:hypothetical protein
MGDQVSYLALCLTCKSEGKALIEAPRTYRAITVHYYEPAFFWSVAVEGRCITNVSWSLKVPEGHRQSRARGMLMLMETAVV